MKTLKYIAMSLATVALASSCDVNEELKFSDSEAFVAFTKGAVTVQEDAPSAKVTISLASVSGLKGNAKISVVTDAENGFTAVEGKDFTISATSVSFSNESREASIEIIPIPNGIYTGDMKFKLVLNSDDVKVGHEKECVVTISDIEHPLASILHSYKASADSYFASRGHFDWNIVIMKDDKDVEKVWIDNLEPYFAVNGFKQHVYGIVTSVDGVPVKISVPAQQALGYNDGTIEVFSEADPDSEDAYQLSSSENLEILIEEDGHKLTILNAYGAYAGGWYNLMYGNIVITY